MRSASEPSLPYATVHDATSTTSASAGSAVCWGDSSRVIGMSVSAMNLLVYTESNDLTRWRPPRAPFVVSFGQTSDGSSLLSLSRHNRTNCVKHGVSSNEFPNG